MSLEETEKRRAARREATEQLKAEQYEKDMAALDQLEEEHGETCVKALHVGSFVHGLPTFVVVKSPGGTSYHKRFVDNVRKANGNKQLEGAAQDMLARASIVYPADAETLAAMLTAFPNMYNDVAAAAVDFVKLRAEDEKKG